MDLDIQAMNTTAYEGVDLFLSICMDNAFKSY